MNARFIKRLLCVLLVSILMLSCFACDKKPKNPDIDAQLNEYIDNRYCFKFGIPSDWNKSEENTDSFACVVLRFDYSEDSDKEASIMLIIDDRNGVKGGTNLDSYYATGIEQLSEAVENYKCVSESTRTLSGYDAKIISYTGNSDSKSLSFIQCLSVIDETVFSFTLTASENEFSTAEKILNRILDSFEKLPDNGEEYITYVDNERGFSIKHPRKWLNVSYKDVTVGFFARYDDEEDEFKERITVVIEDISKYNFTLKGYYDRCKSTLEANVPEYTFIDEQVTTINGQPAMVINYSGKDETRAYHWRQAVMQKNGTAYIISFAAENSRFTEYSEAAIFCESSFTLLK